MYLQDDFRIHEKLTLNLGLRWEYEGGLFDPEYRLPREVDLTQPVPGLQAAIDPRIPANIKAMMAESAGQKSYIYNGAYYFTDEENPRNAKVSRTAVDAQSRARVEPQPARRPFAPATAGSTRRRCSSTRTPRWDSSISARSAR